MAHGDPGASGLRGPLAPVFAAGRLHSDAGPSPAQTASLAQALGADPGAVPWGAARPRGALRVFEAGGWRAAGEKWGGSIHRAGNRLLWVLVAWAWDWQ